MSDFANSEALKEAKKYDPDGRRTLGVVTKTDNVQAGCGIKAKLRMEDGHVRLKLGFIAVVNRTPIEVEEDTPAEEVRAREEKFFTTNPELAGLEKERWGLDTLVERIVEIQEERIEEVSVRLSTSGEKKRSGSCPHAIAFSSCLPRCGLSPRYVLEVFSGYHLLGRSYRLQIGPNLATPENVSLFNTSHVTCGTRTFAE